MTDGNSGPSPSVFGIVAEYNPFHNGHLKQLDALKTRYGADFIVCVLSCAFTQRGLPAMLSTHARAEMALRCGADLVLGMPYSFGTAQANRFAMGGVGILHRLGVVNRLCFGVEEALLPVLERAGALAGSDACREGLARGLKGGLSFARAQGEALQALLPDVPSGTLNAPNFNLGLCYLDALKRLGSAIAPLAIAREGGYHDTAPGASPSAAAVRLALQRGDWGGVKAAVPKDVYPLLRRAALDGGLHAQGALDRVLLHAVSRLQPQDMRGVPDISEGLEHRILSCLPQAASRAALAERVKTKRYPYARISRALTHLMVGLTPALCPPVPPYARLLGFRERALPLLSRIRQGGFPLVSRPARTNDPSLALDMRAEQLWHLGAGQPMANAYQAQVIIIK